MQARLLACTASVQMPLRNFPNSKLGSLHLLPSTYVRRVTIPPRHAHSANKDNRVYCFSSTCPISLADMQKNASGLKMPQGNRSKATYKETQTPPDIISLRHATLIAITRVLSILRWACSRFGLIACSLARLLCLFVWLCLMCVLRMCCAALRALLALLAMLALLACAACSGCRACIVFACSSVRLLGRLFAGLLVRKLECLPTSPAC